MTKALLLAAGQGSRLRPYTNDRPKAMVSLFGKPLIERQIETLRTNQIDEIAIATGYQAMQLEGYGKTYHNPQYMSSNMVTSLFTAEPFFSDEEDLLIAYTDIVYSNEVLRNVLEGDGDIVVSSDSHWQPYWSLRMTNVLQDVESFRVSPETGRILELGQNVSDLSDVQGQYIGLVLVKGGILPKLLEFYRGLDPNEIYGGKDKANMYLTTFLQLLINSEFVVKPAFHKRGWLEVDTVSDLELYHRCTNLSDALNLGL